MPGIRTLTMEEWKLVQGGGDGAVLGCTLAHIATGVAVGALFGNPLIGATLGVVRGLLLCSKPAR